MQPPSRTAYMLTPLVLFVPLRPLVSPASRLSWTMLKVCLCRSPSSCQHGVRCCCPAFNLLTLNDVLRECSVCSQSCALLHEPRTIITLSLPFRSPPWPSPRSASATCVRSAFAHTCTFAQKDITEVQPRAEKNIILGYGESICSKKDWCIYLPSSSRVVTTTATTSNYLSS